jgi:DNA anti-recombination protein RmuC
LDEVVADVASLKTDFKQLENRFVGLENKFEVLETKFDALESRLDAKIDSLIAQFNEFKMELRLEIQMAIHKSMKWSIGLLAFIITFLKALEMLLAK